MISRLCILAVCIFASGGVVGVLSLKDAGFTNIVLGVFSLGLLSMALFNLSLFMIGFCRWYSRGRCRPSPEGKNRRIRRVALVMPIYHEDTAHVFQRVRTTWQSICRGGLRDQCEFFLLSDSVNPKIEAEEEAMYWRIKNELRPQGAFEPAFSDSADTVCMGGLEVSVSKTVPFSSVRERTAPQGSSEAALAAETPSGLPFVTSEPFHLLRRSGREKFKAGNIMHFLEQCGHQYEYMVVLDADSTMLGTRIEKMIDRMEAQPELGILQSVIMPIGAVSPFTRSMQYGIQRCLPAYAEGMAWFFGSESIYWGHNAIIRVRPFMQHCNLPLMPGDPPLGGQIMSQDIVEAALMGRAGWKVDWDLEVEGSYDELPPNILLYAKRDRRWCQGNFQHFWLIFGDGMKLGHRWYFAIGILTYLFGPLILLLTLWGFLSEIRAGGWDWSVRSITGFLLMISLLFFIPRAIGLLRWFILSGGRGWFRELASTGVEWILAMFTGPLLFYLHSQFVWEIFSGKMVPWKNQRRDPEAGLTWKEAGRLFWVPTVLGLIWLGAALHFLGTVPVYLWMLVGSWTVSIPFAVITSNPVLGNWMTRAGLFPNSLTAEEETELY